MAQRLPAYLSALRLQPGRHFRLIGRNRIAPRHRHTDLVKAVEQAMLAERIDVEPETILKRRRYRLILKIDGDRIGPGHFDQPIDGLLRQYDRNDAVLDRIP